MRASQTQRCECSDPGCPCCHGHCDSPAVYTVYRVDMEDATGTAMCDGCGADAMDSGLFTTEPAEAEDEDEDQDAYLCHHCGTDIGWDAPSGVCSERCLRLAQGLAPKEPSPGFWATQSNAASGQ